MLTGHQKDVQPQVAPMPGAKGAFIQWFVGPAQGAKNFYLRRIIVEAGGEIPDHAHPEEHEIYILTGHIQVRGPEGTVAVGPGDFLFIPPGELHGYTNSGQETVTFICCVKAN